jgi:hypothetical protein
MTSTAEERLRARIRKSFADVNESISDTDMRDLEEETIRLIRAYGGAMNGNKDAIFNQGIEELRKILRRRHTGEPEYSTSQAY